MKSIKFILSTVLIFFITIINAQNLTGTWKDQDNNPYYIRQDGNNIYWFGEKKNNRGWANVFIGTKNGTNFSGTFYDIPKGGAQGTGNIGYKIEGNTLTMVSGSGFGSTVLRKRTLNKLSALSEKYLGPRNEQFKNNNSLTGLWYGNDGGRYYVRQVGNKVVWFGENRTNTGKIKSGFANVAVGTRSGNRLPMKFVDVPKAAANGKGNFVLTIKDNKIMTKPEGNFGAKKFVKDGHLDVTSGIMPKSKIEDIMNNIFSAMRIHINNFGPRNKDSWYLANDNYIEIFGNQTILENIGELKRGWKKRKRYYINDFNMESAHATFDGDDLKVTITMETEGREIKGMCRDCLRGGDDGSVADLNLTNPKFEIIASLTALNCSIAFNVKKVKYLGGVDGRGFVEIVDGIIERKMKPNLQKGIKDALQANRTKIAEQLKTILGEGCVRRVSMNGDIIILDR